MTDIEITKRCARAMGYTDDDVYPDGLDLVFRNGTHYAPLYDAAQAMALVKKFRLNIGQLSDNWCKVFTMPAEGKIHEGEAQDLNRAICECVAKMATSAKRG